MDPRLQLAIENDDVDVLHRLIVEDRNLLDHVSEDPFPNTPLHIAAAAGKTQVAMEVAILKPSFARKLNPEGYSPMHLALQHEHYHTARALMTLDPELIRVRGRCGITPLHYVTEKEGGDELELLAEFLSACRSSIEDLTSRCETAVHVAVKNHNLNAFKVLFGWLKRVHLTQILQWKDQDGNTVLHIAASEGQYKVIKLLIGYTYVTAKNFEGKTALEIFQVNPSGGPDVAKTLRRLGRQARRSTPTLSLSQFFSRELTPFEKCANCFRFPNESARNTVLIVTTLIAAASYEASLTPPGGFRQDSSSNPPANFAVDTANSSSIALGKPHHAGDIILSGLNLYDYMSYNGMTFFASIATIWATTFTLEASAISAAVYIFLPLYLFCRSYSINFSIQIPGTNVGELFNCLRIAILLLPMYFALRHIRYRVRIDATWRRVQDRIEDWK